MFKGFFKDKVKAHDAGLLLFYVIYKGLFEDDEAISANWLLNKLELDTKELVDGYQIEIILGVMYQAMLIVNNNYKQPTNYLIFNGLTEAYLEVLKEKGVIADNIDYNYYLSLWEKRFKEYAEAEKKTTLWGPAYWIGKLFLENIIKKDQDILNLTTNIRIATCAQFLTAKLKGFEGTLKSITVVN
ncbi:MAG: hypothetical protein FJ134_02250 [Deltaproteobacteria bacterium]|nr:hypothetical protein [Deltaproteobacteria bacterium]